MIIKIAGAGAGKTTTMAKRIVDKRKKLPENKMIYCITYTNNAVNRILDLLSQYYEVIPKNIKVSTIHSFLYQEIIKPYYYLLYDKQYENISDISLNSNPKYRNYKIAELEKHNILHVSVFTTRAKWVLSKKSKDTKREKEKRVVLLNNFAQYCGQLFIDEAQDMNNDMAEIVEVINDLNIPVELVGDPKQDLNGFGSLRKIATEHPSETDYINDCHRCPQIHLNISNTLVSATEKQTSRKTKGTLNFFFESEHDVRAFINRGKYDLIYISKKNNKYDTHQGHSHSDITKSLFYEIQQYFDNSDVYSDKNVLFIKRMSYYYSIQLFDKYITTKNAKIAMKVLTQVYNIDNTTYTKIIKILTFNFDEAVDKISVQSINRVKGQEGEHCLFILTNDLAAYLFGEKRDDNKVKHQLYVALTRSLNQLSILISDEVEKLYSKEYIIDYFSNKV